MQVERGKPSQALDPGRFMRLTRGTDVLEFRRVAEISRQDDDEGVQRDLSLVRLEVYRNSSLVRTKTLQAADVPDWIARHEISGWSVDAEGANP